MQHRRIFLVVFVLVALIGTLAFVQQRAAAAGDCQCSQYVGNVYKISAYGHGKDGLAWFQKAKYKTTVLTPNTSAPAKLAGSVVSFPANWDSAKTGIGKYGHIGIVESASYDSKAKVWTVTVRHANWYMANKGKTSTNTAMFSSYSCPNVRITTFKISPALMSQLTFFTAKK